MFPCSWGGLMRPGVTYGTCREHCSMRSIIDTTKNWKRPMKTIKNADRVSNLGPSCGRLEPSCPSLGRSWGLVGQSWPQVEPMLRPCRIETENLDDVVPICTHAQIITTAGNLFYPFLSFFWRRVDPENVLCER